MDYSTAVPIAKGGMSELTKAWDERLQRWVALKQLRSTPGPRCSRD